MRKMILPESHVQSHFKGVMGITWLRYSTVVNVQWPRLGDLICLCMYLCIYGGSGE